MPTAEQEDTAFMQEFRGLLSDQQRNIQNYIDGEIGKVNDDLRLVKERGSRPPGAMVAASGHETKPLLQADNKFHDWIRAARGKKSSYATSFTFDMRKPETRAVAPILNVGGTVPYYGIAGPQQAALRLVELLPQVPMSLGAAASYAQETVFTPAAGIVAEGALKPETIIDFTDKLATVKTIATWTKVSIQSLADTPNLRTWIDQRLRYAVLLKAEDTFLNAAAPDGLLAVAGSLAAGFTPVSGTPLDQIGAAISQLQAAGYTPDGVVVNGVDAWKMRGLKDTNENYLWASPDSAVGTTAVWSVPLVISPSIAAGTWLVGAFAQSTILFVRQLLVVEIAFENEDDFVKNLACIRAEERAALAVPVPGGLVKGTFEAEALAAGRQSVPAERNAAVKEPVRK